MRGEELIGQEVCRGGDRHPVRRCEPRPRFGRFTGRDERRAVTTVPGQGDSVAGRSSVDRATFRGLPPTIRDAQGRVRHGALTDELTELPNRLHFDVIYRLLWEAAGRGVPVTMVLFELPGLGSASGEGQLLVGRKANEITRQMDMIARLDQDRIGALMIDCNAFGALVAAERFQVELAPILTDLKISLGAGIAAWRDWMTNPDDLLRAAEEALRFARSQGPDRIEMHGS
jgi:GGDEF domain-containing protein